MTKPKPDQGFVPVNHILSKKIREYKLEKIFYKYQAIKYWQMVSQSFVGETKELAQAVDLRNGVLIVACLSKELAYQIKLLAHRIVEEINRLIGRQVVYAVYVES